MLFRKTVEQLRRRIPLLAPEHSGERKLEIILPDPALAEGISKNNYLAAYARSVTSQDGEDGVLAEIMRRMGITKGWCVEFGAWDGKFHSNTWDVVHNHGWKAVYIESFAKAFETLVKNCEGLPDVYCFNDAVSSEGDSALDAIFARTPIPADFDLLVVDIDGDDFYVWRACEIYRPKVVMIEFNPFVAADIYFVKPAGEDIRASASLLADCELAKSKGYELICVVGGNAIFVRKEDYALFSIADNRPSSMFQSRWETKIFQGYDGNLFLAGNRRLVWRHQVDRSGVLNHVLVTDADIQVLPDGLRIFRPRLSYKNVFLEEHAGRLDRARVPSNRLLAFQKNVTSECGEDGILEHIFGQLGIANGYCVEIGAFDGVAFSNTWSLINKAGWRALLVENDTAAYTALQALYEKKPSVTTLQANVATNGDASLSAILRKAGAPKQFDFLCIDVEGNDYNLWASLYRHRPKVVMVDFNPSVPNDVLFAQEDSSEVNHGASLRAFIELGKSKGYELAAVTTWNAIFVHEDFFEALGISDNSIDKMYYPVFEMKIFHSINCYLSTTGCDRLVRHNYVFDPEQIQALPPNVRVLPFTTETLGELKSTFF